MASRSPVLQTAAQVSRARARARSCSCSYTLSQKGFVRMGSAYYSKSLMLSRDSPLVNPRYTILTLPDATQRAVLDAANARRVTHLSRDNIGIEERAAFILASPRYATWLSDPAFMSALVYTLRPTRDRTRVRNFHVLAGVVDGLCPRHPSREMQEGFSIQLGKLHALLPGLWDLETSRVRKAGSTDPSRLSVILNRTGKDQDTVSVNLPLANTLFQTGRRSTLIASEWSARGRVTDLNRSPMKMVRRAGKLSQSVDLSLIDDKRPLLTRCPLVPITHPRTIIEGLGNILAKVDIEGEPSPASKELQVNLPQWIQAYQSQSKSDHVPGPVGVWALVIPGNLVAELDSHTQQASPEIMEELHGSGPFINNHPLMSPLNSLATNGKLAFEMTQHERMAWQVAPILHDLLSKGAHFHKILSGGGEWGAKASLLSLDPETGHGPQSEEDELDRFQRSFHGDRNAEGSIMRPGDVVQFFVEGDPDLVPKPTKQRNRTTMMAGYLPTVSFGVCSLSANDNDPKPPATEFNSKLDAIGRTYLAVGHFGGMSTEALYVSSKSNFNTKLDTPGTRVGIDLDPDHSHVGKRGTRSWSGPARVPLGGGLNPT